MRCTGFSAFIAPWKTTEILPPAEARSCSSVSASTSTPPTGDRARHGRALRQQPRDRQRRRRLAAARLPGEAQRLARFEREVHPAHRLDRARRDGVAHAQVLDLQQRRHRRSRSRGLSAVHGVSRQREPQHDRHDAQTGRHEVPPRAAADGAGHEREVQHRPPRDVDGVAQPQERERRLRQDAAGDHQHGVREDQRRDVRQDVPR